MASTHTARARVITATVASLALLAGCAGGQSAPEATPPPTSAAGTAAEAEDRAAGTDEDAATTEGGARSAAPSTAPDAAPGPVPEGLDDYYSQPLDWSACEGAFECASLTVPVDYAQPDGATLDLALLRVPAAGTARGSLVVNPGGPGVSGVDYARLAGPGFGPELLESYDVVGFDPRGVGRSAPLTCLSDAEMDEFIASDPTPDDAEEEARLEAQLEEFAQACVEAAPDLLGHLSTVEVARDLDVLRAALGDEQLTYLGASYGTFIGTTYAVLFPENVGRMVLDGALDPTLTAMELGLGQAEGFERATRAYAEDCVAGGSCPLGSDVESVLSTIGDLLDRLDSDPLPVTGDVAGELTEGWGLYGVIAAMYGQENWPVLTQALAQALDGDGTILMLLANFYLSRSSDGTYDGNTMQVIRAVNCLDRRGEASADLDEDAVLAQFEKVAPTWGRYLAGDGACASWPVEAAETIEDYSAPGAPPVVVIGTTRDPATPYEWAVQLADTLDSGVLISFDGDGHTAYGRSNDCVDDAVHAYLLDGVVPQDGLRC
ncbi:alpha/beta fold hydrolase [Ornithinimicrobium flavum]|uniref:alpha/beta fold hydrolase n=1 Tax=Ornithinimicrobium flavum TaxID=1288636 RepID=UPI001EE91EA6|nr:alpha/beta fold hydrolase [Ornithinimicrobium flavum]